MLLSHRLPPHYQEVLVTGKRVLKHPYTISLSSSVLILIFLIWLIATYLPVAVVEAKYQYRKTLHNVFNVTSVRELVLPTLKFADLKSNSKHKEYGIHVPALYLDEPVVFNVDPNDEKAYREALKKGIAHASGTAFPDSPGIGYYFAHSSSPEFTSQYNAVFYLLGKLQPHDEIFIWHENKRFDYVVTESKVTDANDVSFLNQTYDQETIVLQTCWPPGTTQKRMLVFAKRVAPEQ